MGVNTRGAPKAELAYMRGETMVHWAIGGGQSGFGSGAADAAALHYPALNRYPATRLYDSVYATHLILISAWWRIGGWGPSVYVEV